MNELEDKLVALELMAAGLALLAKDNDGTSLLPGIDILRLHIAEITQIHSRIKRGE